MNSVVILGLLIGLLYYLVKAKPQTALSAGAVEADAPDLQPATPPKWMDDWPRHAATFAASVAVAWIVATYMTGLWLDLAVKLGAPLGITPGVFTLAIVGIAAFAIHQTNATPKIKAFAQKTWASITAPPVAKALAVDGGTSAQEVTSTEQVAQSGVPLESHRSAPASLAEAVPPMAERTYKPKSRGRMIALGVVVLIAGVGYLATVANPQAFNTATTWARSTLFGSGTGNDQASVGENAAVADTGAPVDQAEEAIALDQIVEEVLRSARVARTARAAINADLNVALANAETRQMTAEADRIRTVIAAKEQEIVDARKSARDSFALIAEAYGADPAIVTEAIGLVRGKPEVRDDPKGMELLAALSQRSQPEAFVTSAMTAWERATASPVMPATTSAVVPAAPVPTASAPMTETAPPSPAVRPRVTDQRPNVSSFGDRPQGYSRQSGTARDRQRERYPRGEPIADDEIQK